MQLGILLIGKHTKQKQERLHMNLVLIRFEENNLAHLDTWSHAVGAHKYMQKVTPLKYSTPEDLSKWGKDFIWFAITVDNTAIGGCG
ncbi:MAG: hypothetical protein KAH31_08880 [Candidatus Sabulitectum sp.]|nr:hypothetical protein [Candidatus Sabulitectum sp.]